MVNRQLSFQRLILSLSFLFIIAFTTTYSQQTRTDEDLRMRARIVPSTEGSSSIIPYTPIPQSTESRRIRLRDGSYAVVGPNIRVHPSTAATQSEISVNVHPTNANIVLVGSNAASNTSSISWLSQGWYITTDGGTTWSGSDTLPPHFNTNFSNYTSDPVTAIDLNGNMYFNTLFYSGSSGDVVTTKSTNNGATWGNFTALQDAGTDEDKNWFAVDVNSGSPYSGYLYNAYTDFNSAGPGYRRIRFGRSTDGGATWVPNPTANISGSSNYLDQGVSLAVGPNGEVYAAWTNYQTSGLTTSRVGINKSTDGGATFPASTYATPVLNDIRGTLTKGGNSIRCNSFPSISVDRSAGSRSGWVYVSYPARTTTGTAPDIYFVRSSDGGSTWSAPKKVNSEETNKDQWMSWCSVDPSTGALYVVYFDSRNFSANDSAQVYISRSLDGGDTFEDVLISDRAFLPRSIPGLAGGYSGDYINIVANNGMVYAAWNDNRVGHHQCFVAKAIFGPTIEHTALENTEDLTGPYEVSATVTSSGVPLDEMSVKLFWTRGTSFEDSLLMSPTTDDEFVGMIPGNGQVADYRYYIKASDSLGGTSKHPAGAPNDYHQFSAATDTIPPTIEHSSLENQYLEFWPQTISAEVWDNIGVDSVWCEWEVTHSDKAGNPNGTFLLTLNEDGSYSGEFDTEGTTLVVGDTIHYAIYARDNGSGHLLGRLPENGNFNFTFIADNTLPTIVHNPLRNQPRLRWPSTVKATVSDLLGIEEVLVEWYKNDVGNSSSFELESDDNDNYAGIFNSDSNMIAIGDSIFYRIKATDASNSGNVAYYPEEGYWKFSIIATKGIVLVIDDDATGSFRAMPKSGSSFKADTIDMNGSAGLFRRTLTELGYIVDTMKVPQVDTTEWDNYDIVVWSHGRSSSPADSVKWRRALSSRVQRGMSVIIEGGDIGWQYMSSSTDVDFATNVLHCNDFIMESNTLANPKLKDPTHPLATNPNTLPAQYTLEGTAGVYDRDANQPLLNATTVFSWSGNDTTMSVLAWDDTPNPLRGRVVYIGFNINNVVKAESTEVKNLIENAADWLVGSEPPPTGAASGMVTLQNTSDNSGVNVRIKGPTIDETIQTPESGYYRFENLYAGTHKLYAWKNGYYPAMDSLVINVGSDSSINNNFTFMPTGPVSGTIILQGTPNNSGVNVVIKGSGTNDTLVTPESGMYEFSNLNAGLHKIYAWKTGYYPTIDSLSVVVTAETLANRNFSFAQLVLGAVSGSVTLEGTNDHSGVEVKILNHNLTATTQTNGSYQFSNVTPGPISLRFSKSGYARKDTLTALPNGGSLTVNVHLKTLSNIILVVYDSTLTNGRVSKDSIAQNLEAMNLPYEVRNRGGNTSTIEFSMSDYNTVIWLGEGTSTSSLSQRDSIKSFLINGVPSSPSKLIIFAEDFGYQHGRSGSTYLDLELCNNYLGWNYVADRPGTGASQGIIGDYINNGIADSTVGTWPDVLSPYDGEVTVGLYRFRRHDSLNAIGHITDNFVTATFGVDIRSLRSAFDSPPGSPVTRLLTGALNFVNEPVGVDARAAREIPTVYSLSQNYPNPFNPVTTIRFGLPEESNTTLRVFNVLGQEVAILLNNVQSAGYHEFQWDAASVSSGVYFYRLEATSVTSNKTFTKINKMVLMK